MKEFKEMKFDGSRNVLVDAISKLIRENEYISEIQTNGPEFIFYKERGVRKVMSLATKEPGAYNEAIDGLIQDAGLKKRDYVVEGRYTFPGGNRFGRLHIAMPPATPYPLMTLAIKTDTLKNLTSIQGSGSFNTEMSMFLKAAVASKLTMVISGGTGAGKALHKETEIPTPDGFKTVNDLNVGDVIFDEKNDITKILEKYCPMDPKCYELEFKTGQKVKASGGHLWKVNFHGVEEIVTTEDIYSIYNSNSNFKYSIQRAQKGVEHTAKSANIEFKDYTAPTEHFTFHQIEKIERIDDNPEDYFCFQVDSPSKLFLCTKEFIPTHNTTLLEAVTTEIKNDERVGVCEDSPELELQTPNTAYLNSTVWSPGMNIENVADLSWVVQQINRMRVDRIIIGETRGKEFFDFVVAANSGKPGSLTTIHANDGPAAMKKMATFMYQSVDMSPRIINEMLSEAVDIVIQLGHSKKTGDHKIVSIHEVTDAISSGDSPTIALNPLFVYNDTDNTWSKKYATDKLKKKLEAHGYDSNRYSLLKNNEELDDFGGGLPSYFKKED